MRKTIFLIITLLLIALTKGAVYANSGDELNIDVYVNGEKLKTPVYKNLDAPPVRGHDYTSSYVDLCMIFEKLGATTKRIDSETIHIIGERTGYIEIKIGKGTYRYESSSFTGENTDYSSIANQTTIINNRPFIEFANVRYIINGSLDEDKNAIYLYSKDFERVDIPANLNECYKKLDTKLSDIEKFILMSTPKNDLALYHMSLGLWIRNNWIYPSNTRIAKKFLNKGIKHPDDMSAEIINGYHNYLNQSKKNEIVLIILFKSALTIAFICLLITILKKVFKYNKARINRRKKAELM